MKRISCNCSSCQNACRTKPGWMKFGDEIKMAEKLGLTVKELFDNHLAVDWWQDEQGNDYFGLSPYTTNNEPGKMFPYDPRGVCGFFKDGKCQIHNVAPTECKNYIHSMKADEPYQNHAKVAKTWDSPEAKQLITDLLGYEPAPIENDGSLSIFSLLGY